MGHRTRDARTPGRLLRLRRNVLGEAAPAPFLLRCATEASAAAAGMPQLGVIAEGRPADLCAVDLDAPGLSGCADDAQTLASAIVFAAGAADMTDTWVGGRPVIVDGHHPLEAPARAAFEAVQQRLWSAQT